MGFTARLQQIWGAIESIEGRTISAETLRRRIEEAGGKPPSRSYLYQLRTGTEKKNPSAEAVRAIALGFNLKVEAFTDSPEGNEALAQLLELAEPETMALVRALKKNPDLSMLTREIASMPEDSREQFIIGVQTLLEASRRASGR
ncbi:hypothetical protein ACWDWV_08425 [Streptosporangium sandarakinum]